MSSHLAVNCQKLGGGLGTMVPIASPWSDRRVDASVVWEGKGVDLRMSNMIGLIFICMRRCLITGGVCVITAV